MSIVFLSHTAVTVLWRLCLFRKRSSETLNQTDNCQLRLFCITPGWMVWQLDLLHFPLKVCANCLWVQVFRLHKIAVRGKIIPWAMCACKRQFFASPRRQRQNNVLSALLSRRLPCRRCFARKISCGRCNTDSGGLSWLKTIDGR